MLRFMISGGMTAARATPKLNSILSKLNLFLIIFLLIPRGLLYGMANSLYAKLADADNPD
jgi:hypothetical protein